ncbi:hypothetical protein NL676_007035, partial [Syzygium grande]
MVPVPVLAERMPVCRAASFVAKLRARASWPCIVCGRASFVAVRVACIVAARAAWFVSCIARRPCIA